MKDPTDKKLCIYNQNDKLYNLCHSMDPKSTKKVFPINKKQTTEETVAKKAKNPDPLKKKRQETMSQNKAFLKAALDITKKTKARCLFVYVDAIDESLITDKIPNDLKLIFVTKNKSYSQSSPHDSSEIITLPSLKLGRMGIVKIAVILALSAKQVKPNDNIVFMIGKAENECIDTVISLKIDEESELLTGHSIAEIPTHIESTVFEHALNIAIELGNNGKEGKPVGTIFVLGDEERVMQLSKQMIINPFRGYEAEERNLLNPTLRETIREFSTLDGAFVIAGNGEVITAGRYLGAAMEDSDIPRGLGSRHIAAAGITALTNAIAIVISESTGDVRIFKNGKVIMSLDKPNHK